MKLVIAIIKPHKLDEVREAIAALGVEGANGRILVGFAADLGDEGLARAREKLARKRLNLIVFNDVSRSDVGFDADENEVVLVSPEGETTIARRDKAEIAAAILDRVATLLRGG